jgi:hypothetical protein
MDPGETMIALRDEVEQLGYKWQAYDPQPHTTRLLGLAARVPLRPHRSGFPPRRVVPDADPVPGDDLVVRGGAAMSGDYITNPDAHDSTPARGSPPLYTRVYRRTGHYAHLQMTDGSHDILCQRRSEPCCLRTTCCCGQDPDSPACYCAHLVSYEPDTWLGTGAQHEYEKAAALPLCPRCFAVREHAFPDPRLGSGHDRDLREEQS